jgi:toxin ParE1/3/4
MWGDWPAQPIIPFIMPSRVRFHPEALDEFVAAAAYYGERAQAIGLAFVARIEDGIALIAERPHIAPSWPGRPNVRRRVLSTFPYAIIYTVEPDEIAIIAIEHTRRRPGYWQQRL